MIIKLTTFILQKNNIFMNGLNILNQTKLFGLDPYPTSLRITNWIKWIIECEINDR